MENLVYIPILLICVAPPILGWFIHNGLATLRNRAREAWAAVDAALQARYGLADRVIELAPAGGPALAACLDRCRNHPGPVSGRAAEETRFANSLRAALDESPPAAVAELRRDLTAADLRIERALEAYNAAVTTYRARCEGFPRSLVANLFSLPRLAPFPVNGALLGLRA